MSEPALHPALFRAWYPVARSMDLDRPRLATLLGEELVVYRTAGGAVAVAQNRCPHRGAGLYLGEVVGEGIACPYHGWQFAAGDGQCTLVPSLNPGEKIPPGARIKTFPAVEQWGLVFTCIGNPFTGPPDPPELHDDEWDFGPGDPIPIRVGIAAMTENYRDVSHFPFVHQATIGPTPEVVEPLNVRREGPEVFLDWTFRPTASPSAAWQNDGIEAHYHVWAPAFVCLVLDYGAKGKRVGLNCPSPVGPEECVIYYAEGVTRGFEGATVEDAVESNRQIYAEDVRILESLRPREVPFGEHIEVSVPADKYTLAYRQAFMEYLRVAGA